MMLYVGGKSKIALVLITLILPLSAVRQYDEKNLASCQSFPVAIYHAFHEKFNDIKNNISNLKYAGFSHIQVSPIQQQDLENPKHISLWWNAYRPISYEIGGMYGNENEFKELLTVAHQNGIKIIVDLVLNHLAPLYKYTKNTLTEVESKDWEAVYDKPELLNGYLNQVIEKYKKIGFTTKEHFRAPKDWGFGGCGKKFPSLNLDNSEVRTIHTNFIDKLIKMGVAGFRFDAICSLSNDYWHYLNNHLKEKIKDGYSYGEFPDGCSIQYKRFQDGCSEDNDVHTTDFVLYYEMGKAFPFGLSLQKLQMPALNNDPWAVTFSDNHDIDAYREDTALGISPDSCTGLPGWNGDAIDRLLATVYISARKGGVPLIFNKMYKDHKEVIKNILIFRNEMMRRNASIENIIVINDNAIKIDRGDSGFVIINKSSSNVTLAVTKIGMYKQIGENSSIKDTSLTVSPRSAAFFIKQSK